MHKAQTERAQKEQVARLAREAARLEREAAAAAAVAAAYERAQKAGEDQVRPVHVAADVTRPQHPADLLTMNQETAAQLPLLKQGGGGGAGGGKLAHRSLLPVEASAAAAVAAAAAAASAAAATVRKVALAPKVSLHPGPKTFARARPLVSILPAGVGADDPNVVAIYDADGRLKGYKVWPSEAAMLAARHGPNSPVAIGAAIAAAAAAATIAKAAASPAVARAEDRIKRLAGIVLPGSNGHGGGGGVAGGSDGRVDPAKQGLISGLQAQIPAVHGAVGSGGGAGAGVAQQEAQQREFAGGLGGGKPTSVTVGAPVVIPAVPFLSNGGVLASGSVGARGPQLQATALRGVAAAGGGGASVGSISSGVAPGGAAAGSRSVMPTIFLSTSEAAAASEDGIMLRHVSVCLLFCRGVVGVGSWCWFQVVFSLGRGRGLTRARACVRAGVTSRCAALWPLN